MESSGLVDRKSLKLQLEVPDLSYKGTLDVDPSMLVLELIKQINRTLDYDQLIQQISALNPKYEETEIEAMLAIHHKNVICNEADRVEKYQFKDNDVIVYKLKEKRKSMFSFIKKDPSIIRSKSFDPSSVEGQIIARQKHYDIKPGNHLWKVECPTSNLLRVVEFDDNVTVHQLISAIVEKDGYNDPENWRLLVFVSGVSIPCDKDDALIKYFINTRQRVVLERRYCSIRLNIPEVSKKVSVTVEAKMTVKSLLESVLQHLKLDSSMTKGYGLFLTTASNTRRRMSLLEGPEGQQQSLEYYGLLLDSKRTIGSYRLRARDVLEYRSTKLDFQKQLRKVSDTEQVFVMIDLVEQNISKTLQIEKNMTVKEVVLSFFEKNPVVADPSKYALFHEVRANRRKSTSYGKLNKDTIEFTKDAPVMMRMEESQLISFYKLRHMDKLILRKHLLTDELKNVNPTKLATPSDESDANFGISPAELEMATDTNGFTVPKVLVQLKSCVIMHNGLLNEGIFRAAGSSAKMKQIRESLVANTFDKETETDVNAVASLLKKWFSMLPQKILASFTLQEIETVNGRISNALKEIEGYLVDPYRALWLWIIDLAVVTVYHQESNKMNARNMARLLSPILWEQNDESPLETLENTNKVANFLERLILEQLKTYNKEQ